MKTVKILFMLSLALAFTVVSCSKKDSAKPGKTNAKLILGSWYVSETYTLTSSGDTTNHDHYSRTEDNKVVFKNNGIVSESDGSNSVPYQEYYKVVDNLIYLSDDPLPETLSTSVIDGIDIWAEFIVKVDSKTLIIRDVSDDGTITNDYSILKR